MGTVLIDTFFPLTLDQYVIETILASPSQSTVAPKNSDTNRTGSMVRSWMMTGALSRV